MPLALISGAGVFDKSNGGGFLDDIYPNAYVNVQFSSSFLENLNSFASRIHALTIFAVPKLSGTSRGYSALLATFRTCGFPV